MAIKRQAPAKALIIQFHLHLSSNKQQLADLKILYISSTFGNCTSSNIFLKPISQKLTIINLLFSETSDFLWPFAKIIGVMYFSPLVCLFWSKHNIFSSCFIAMLRTTNLFFLFKNKNYHYICCFYHECVFQLLIWLIG